MQIKNGKNIVYIIKDKKLKKFISLDTRKSVIMEKGIKNKMNLVNDGSGLEHDPDTIKILKTQIYHLLFIHKVSQKQCKKS